MLKTLAARAIPAVVVAAVLAASYLVAPSSIHGTLAASCSYGYAPGVPTITSVSPNAGYISGGMNVTITGTGFCNTGLAVTFGSTPALSTVLISDTSMTAVAPPHAGTVNVTVDIRVTTVGGTSAITVPDKFKYVTNNWCAVITVNRVPTVWHTGVGQSFVVTAFNCGKLTWGQFGSFPIQGSIHFTTKKGGVASKAFWLSLKYHEIRANTPTNSYSLIRFTLTPRGHGALFLEFVMIQVHRFFFDQATHSPVQFIAVPVTVS